MLSGDSTVSIIDTSDYDVTIYEVTGEDANGSAIERVTTWPCAFLTVTMAERRAADGPTSADACHIVISDCDALDTYRVEWDLKPGTKLTIRGNKSTVNDRDVFVNTVVAAENPRTGILNHIEVDCG